MFINQGLGRHESVGRGGGTSAGSVL